MYEALRSNETAPGRNVLGEELRQNIVRPHHFVIFMLKNVAVPYIPPAVSFETHDDTRDHLRVLLHGILPARFSGRGRRWLVRIAQTAMKQVFHVIEASSIQNLKTC